MGFLSQNLQLFGTIATILGLLIAVMIAWRMISPRLLGRQGQRLAVIEYREIDRSRRLVLVRRDEEEHLLLVGGNTDVVIESLAAPPPPLAPSQPVVRPAPRPPVFGDRKPPPLRPLDQPAGRDDPAS